MASIHRHPRSRFFYAAWRDADGRLRAQSTKQTDRSKAMAFALEVERAAKMAGSASLTEQQAKKIINGIMERSGSTETVRTQSAKDWFEGWLRAKESTKSTATMERYRGVITGFIESLGKKAKLGLDSISTQDVERYLHKRKVAGCSDTTRNLDGKIVRSALTKARKTGLIATNPAEAAELPSINSVERGTFTQEEVKLLIGAARGEWRTVIMLGYFTGARLGDCITMRWTGDRVVDKRREGVDFEDGVLVYWAQKTGKPVVVPLHPQLQAHLESLATDDAGEFICPRLAEFKIGGRNGLSERFKQIVRNAGLSLEQTRGTGIRTISRRSFHALRHSFSSALMNQSVPEELRMRLAGHKTRDIHARYSHPQVELLRGAIQKLPSL